jgi:hypothetical protein
MNCESGAKVLGGTQACLALPQLVVTYTIMCAEKRAKIKIIIIDPTD